MSQLFVYGIFLSEHNRKNYGMTNPKYDTVADYTTVGGYIVKATHVPECSLSLTGLLVQLPDDYNWSSLDALEGGYDRIIITTNSGETAYMYVQPQTVKENHNGNSYRQTSAHH